ncbi:MAG TPA: hypothetical protein VKS25_02260 [Solirubrobacteraceae bacterium]|nr:hypothetical protein [Solirubrobacteraceae bacterium]
MRPRARRRTLYLSLTLTLATAAVAAAAATTTARTVTATGGGVTATLSFRHDTAPSALIPYRDLRLSISGGGRAGYQAPVSALLCARECWPLSFPGASLLRVVTLEPGRGADVVLNLYSGGAHCCSITQVFSYASGSYSLAQRDFGDPGSKLERLKGGWVFLSADDRFAYEFTSFAFSGLPLAIWSFRGGRFVDVTRAFPALAQADATRQYKAYIANRRQGLGLGFIAAWAADEDLLGKHAHVATTLGALAAAGELRSGDGFSRGGRAFITALDRFLAKTGYGS